MAGGKDNPASSQQLAEATCKIQMPVKELNTLAAHAVWR